MFIEQSAARRRTVRTLFLLAGVAPCAVLVAAAWWRHSAGHVAGVSQAASAHLGLPVAMESIVHPRPGVLRLARLVVGDAAHGDALVVPEVEVETAAGEVRARVPRIELAPGAARMLAGIAGEWLRRPARFPDAWVVDVGAVAWQPAADAPEQAAAGWRVECVAVDDRRAVRCRRGPASTDDVRVRTGPEGLAVEGAIGEAVPLAILAALVPGLSGWAEAAGPQAFVRGRIDAVCDAQGWSGTMAGTVEHAALDSVVVGGGGRMQGEAMVTVAGLEFSAGRIVAADMVVSASPGTVPQRVLDGLVTSFGCRPGPAYRSIGGDAVRRFDRLACHLTFADGVLHVRSVEGGGGSLIGTQGLSLVDEPAAAVPVTRLAWFLSPEGRPAVPATPASAWLMSVLPENSGF